MKKLKLFGAAVIAASLIFSGCAPQSDDETTTPVEKPGKNNNGENSGGDNTDDNDDKDGEDNGGEGTSDTEYTAPDLSGYFKSYYVNTPATGKSIADWGAGSTATQNEDGTWNLVASEGLWWAEPQNGEAPAPKIPGICAPFTGINPGSLAGYEYLVFTVDTTNFEIDNVVDEQANRGVNVKIPDVQKRISTNYVANGDIRTYYAPLSLFEAAPQTAKEFAIIIGGTGTLKLNEVYFAAAEDPSKKAVTGITITPENASVAQGGTQQFTVKDSNFENRTSEVTYALSGDAATDSEISKDGLLTVGTTAGNLTVTASYTVDEKTFTSSATITVMGAKTNLVKTVAFNKLLKDVGGNVTELGDVVSLNDGVVTVHKPADSAWGEWSCQLFLNVSANEGNIFEADKKYYVSVTVTSSAQLEGCVWKEDTKASIDQHGITYNAGESKTLTAEVSDIECEVFNCLLSFPGAASDITVSDITVYDITE